MPRDPGTKVVFSKQEWLLLADAAAKPSEYAKGKLTKLRYAVDVALSAVSEALLSAPFQNWIVLRQRLNASPITTPEYDAKLAGAVLELLRHRDLIYRKDYTNRSFDVRTFCGR